MSAPPAKAPAREYRGLYENRAYGFSLIISDGLIGQDDGNPDYQRGLTIPFPGGTVLKVYGETNSLEYPNARAAALDSIRSLKDRGRKVVSSVHRPSILSGQPAEMLRVLYTCSNSKTEYQLMLTVALSREKGYVYTISWDGLPAQFALDQAAIEQLEHTWKFLEVK